MENYSPGVLRSSSDYDKLPLLAAERGLGWKVSGCYPPCPVLPGVGGWWAGIEGGGDL